MSALTEAARDAGVDRVEVVFADQHGLLKGRSVGVDALDAVADAGIGVPGSMLAKDTGGTYAVPLWAPSGDAVLDGVVGARNIVLRPDPTTFRPLPWRERTGLVLCDLSTSDGEPIPHSPRAVLARQLDRMTERGWGLVAGFEYELHLYRSAAERGSPDRRPVSHSHPGWDLLGADRLDEADDVLRPLVDGLTELGFPPVTAEVELGPSQIELTFAPDAGLAVADNAAVIRYAVKCLARAGGLHATFMARPAVARSFSSGWHLHHSVVARGAAGDPSPSLLGAGDGHGLSAVGDGWVAGLLEHAAGACLLTTPTVNGYKRYRPHAVAPDRVTWSHQHRGAMIRVVGDGTPGATRVENRVGDPAANPYLYVAAQIISGLAGVEGGLSAPPPSADPYAAAAGEQLPRSLGEAIEAFEADEVLRHQLGGDVAEYLLTIKRSEWSRFLSAVTDWEQNEYFDLF